MTPSRTLVLWLTFVLGTVEPAPAHAQRKKLNAPLATAYLTHVTHFEIGAQGRIVYLDGNGLYGARVNNSVPPSRIADITGTFGTLQLTPDGQRAVWNTSTGLFSLLTDGTGTVVQLAPLASGESVASFLLAPDSQRVVYARSVNVGQDGLYSVPTDGSQAPVLLRALNYLPGYSTAQVTSDSARVLFNDYDGSSGAIYTVPIAGGAPPVTVHPPMPAGRDAGGFQLTPDATRVVYVSDFDTDEVFELYSAPVDGSGPQLKISGPGVAGGDVYSHEISTDSTHVVYVADHVQDQAWGVFDVPLLGGTPVTLFAGAPNKRVFELVLSPDSTRVVYRREGALSHELYSAPCDGSHAPARMDPTVGTGWGVSSFGFSIDAASERVVFQVAKSQTEVRLYSALLDGSAPAVWLDGGLGSQAGAQLGMFRVGEERVAFVVGGKLYSRPIDASAPALQLDLDLAHESVTAFELNPAGIRALYRTQQSLDGLAELFIVPLDGSLNPGRRSAVEKRFATVGDVHAFALAPDGATAVYDARLEAGRDLYAVNLSDTPASVPLHTGGQSTEFRITPDSQRCIYRTSTIFGMLLSVPLDASAAAVAIDEPAFGIESWEIAPDSSRVVELIQSDFYGEPDSIFSAPVAGGSPPVELNVPRALNGQMAGLRISPDSSRVVYAGVQQSAGVVELFSVPLAGGSPPVRLNGALVTGGDVQASPYDFPEISSDSSRVVYRADQEVDAWIELYSVPLAGGEAPLELSALSGPEQDVTSFQISPDSTSVVYVADQDQDEDFELYSVPLAGGAAPLDLSALSGAGRDVDTSEFFEWNGYALVCPFLVSPDSTRVVYRADQDVDEAFELYSVPLEGGAPPVRLTFHAGTGAPPDLLFVTPDSRTAVYMRATAGGNDLFAVALDGASAPVQLNGPHPLTGGFPYSLPAELDSSGSWVLFQAAPDAPGVNELFVAPLHGGHLPVRVDAGLASGEATTFGSAFRPGASSVVYIAAQDEAGVFELFVNQLVTRRSFGLRPR